ncbi:GNAT family N-acetyltransferase [Maribacter sp. 2308TA10-17]|uniref:GNAT family N-acetyltransferase n=1 Tax=Maribacter sp. 2308TA10-17 TaxID=3386276 RepID=UPI0039BD2A5A
MNFSLQPFLENNLVKVRPLEESDFAELYKLASDPLLWEQHQNKDRYTKEKFTLFFEEAISSKTTFAILDVKTNRIIGSSRFKSIDESEGVVEIGWSFLARSHWGGQFNRSFKTLMVNHALKKYRYVIFHVNSLNFRSQKAMEKLGAEKISDDEKPWALNEAVGITYYLDTPIKD